MWPLASLSLTNEPHLVNNKNKLDNETSESVDGSLWTKNFVKIYNENEKKFTNIPYSFFSSSKLVIIKKSKRKKEKKITLVS